MEIKNEEFICHSDDVEENGWNKITVEGRINIYAGDKCYTKVVKVRLTAP